MKVVICSLISLIKSENPNLVAAAGFCLGAIGPVDLQTLTLPKGLLDYSSVRAMGQFANQEYEKYCWLLHSLDDCLRDKRSVPLVLIIF